MSEVPAAEPSQHSPEPDATIAAPVNPGIEPGITVTDAQIAAADTDATVTDVAATDVIDFAGDKTPRKRRRTAIVSGVAAVLVAAAGVGAYAGVRAWTGSAIVEPEAAVPASTAAFVRIDLKPGYRDQIAFDGLAKKFPRHGKSTQSLVTDLEKSMVKGSDLNFDQDVKPWFGERAGIGAYADQPDHVVGLIALASKDDVRAKQVLSREQQAHPNTFGFVVRDGYALLAVGGTDLQATAEAASKAAAKSSLADDKAFTDSISRLPGDNLAVAYADLSKVAPLIATALKSEMSGAGAIAGLGGMPGGPSLGGLGMLSGLAGSTGGSSTDALTKATGHIAVGAGIVDDGIEIHVHADGAQSPAKAGVDAKATLDAMPDNAIVAFAARGVDSDSATIKQLNAALAGTLGMAGGSEDPSAAAMQHQMGTMVTSLLTSKVISLEFSGMTGKLPNLMIAADTGDANAASTLMQSLEMFNGTVPGVEIKQDGTSVRATVGTAPSGGKLGASALYAEAMKGAGASSAASYIDVQKLLQLAGPGANTATMAPVKAIGFSTSTSGITSDALVRIVIKK